MRQKRQTLILVITILFSVMGVGLFILNLPPSQPEFECYEEQVQNMTVKEVSNLLNISLAEHTWLPDNLNIVPIISTYKGFSDCWVDVNYLSSTLPRISIASISIRDRGAIVSTKMPTNCTWHFTPIEAIKTNCNIEIDGSQSTLSLDLYVSPEYPPEIALQILDGIRVIEPSE